MASGSTLAAKGAGQAGKGLGRTIDLQLFRGGRFTPDQDALVQLAKEAQRKGVTPQEAGILKDWAREYNMPFRPTGRPYEIHPNRPYGPYPHIHIGPIDHIPVRLP